MSSIAAYGVGHNAARCRFFSLVDLRSLDRGVGTRTDIDAWQISGAVAKVPLLRMKVTRKNRENA
jgi:hypothetical protein